MKAKFQENILVLTEGHESDMEALSNWLCHHRKEISLNYEIHRISMGGKLSTITINTNIE